MGEKLIIIWEFIDLILMIIGGIAFCLVSNLSLYLLIVLIFSDGSIINNFSAIMSMYLNVLLEYQNFIMILVFCIQYFVVKMIGLEILD